MLGGCLRLQEEPRKVFIRTLMLFSLTDTVLDEDMANGQATQLYVYSILVTMVLLFNSLPLLQS